MNERDLAEWQAIRWDCDNSSRQCIGCLCCRVPWNQGSDYCDECMTDSETQRTPHDETESRP